MTSIVIVDDHELMAKALSGLIQKFENYDVLYEVSGGEELIQRFSKHIIPDIVLLDINMPGMDGFTVAEWLKNNHPQVKILALSMNDKNESIIKMLRNGASGYLLKGCKPSELRHALDTVIMKGFYYSEYVTSQLVKNLSTSQLDSGVKNFGINERERQFIKLSCSDLTYVEIADKMCVSPRTVDGYRESVFQKLSVKSRVGMVLAAIKLKLVEL